VPALPPAATVLEDAGPAPVIALRSVAVTPAGAAAGKPIVKKKNLVAQNVAVLDFAHAGGNPQSGVQAADVVSQQLAGNGGVNLIDRDKVQQVQAQALMNQGFVAQSGQNQGQAQSQMDLARAVGQQVGADAVVVGNVEEKLGTLVILSVSGKNASGKFTGTGVPRAGDIALGHKEKAERK